MLRTHWISVYYLLSSFILIQRSSSENALIGNVRRAKQGEFPFVVSISFNNPDKTIKHELNHGCGGALITQRHVLTAAHCFDEFGEHYHKVVIKTNDGDLHKSTSHRVKKWTIYYDWAKNYTINKDLYDIAVVELHESVGSHINPACISCLPEAEIYGKKAQIVGWATTKNHHIWRHLLTAEVIVLDSLDCFRNHLPDTKDRLNSNKAHLYMCTKSYLPVSTESGDSGSPLLKNSNEIIAVHHGNTHYHYLNGSIGRTENIHIPIKHFNKFLNKVAPCEQRYHCCVQ